MKENIKNYYYSGGLAELANQPTNITYKYLSKWFTGNKCLGEAYNILQLPYNNINVNPLELVEKDLVVNLKKEEELIYANTLFTYKPQTNISNTPSLKIDAKKISVKNILNTLKIIIVQSKWLGNQPQTLKQAKMLLKNIPESSENTEIVLETQVFPNVIAIGILSEFYYQVLMQTSKNKKELVQKYIDQKLAKKDWFFKSITQMYQVKTGKMSFTNFIKEYGIRADKDYELTCPRWHEIPNEIEKRIQNTNENILNKNKVVIQDKKLLRLAKTCYKMQVIRSQAKRKALIHIDLLRKNLIQKKAIDQKINENTNAINRTYQEFKNYAKGRGVSSGLVVGTAKHINSAFEKIEDNTIGIFPNASIEFSTLYNKCKGIIFLKGGTTSHGAIVAREFEIPAIVEESAVSITNGKNVQINGQTGEWKKI